MVHLPKIMVHLTETLLCSLNFSSVNFEQLNRIICDIRNKSPVMDELPMSDFKDNLKIFDVAVVYIVNKSLAHGIFPSELKMAKIIPIHKSGDKDKIENYRPISLLPVFSKILEKIIATQIENYLTSDNLIYVKQ